jgi:PleD family two-component response regulator
MPICAPRDAQPPTLALAPEGLKQQPRRILIAEDNNVNRKLFQRILGTAGYIVDSAVDGAEMVEKTLARYGTTEQ